METRAKFNATATKRMNRAIKAIRQVGMLGSHGAFVKGDIDLLCDTLASEIGAARLQLSQKLEPAFQMPSATATEERCVAKLRPRNENKRAGLLPADPGGFAAEPQPLQPGPPTAEYPCPIL